MIYSITLDTLLSIIAAFLWPSAGPAPYGMYWKYYDDKWRLMASESWPIGDVKIECYDYGPVWWRASIWDCPDESLRSRKFRTRREAQQALVVYLQGPRPRPGTRF